MKLGAVTAANIKTALASIEATKAATQGEETTSKKYKNQNYCTNASCNLQILFRPSIEVAFLLLVVSRDLHMKSLGMSVHP